MSESLPEVSLLFLQLVNPKHVSAMRISRSDFAFIFVRDFYDPRAVFRLPEDLAIGKSTAGFHRGRSRIATMIALNNLSFRARELGFNGGMIAFTFRWIGTASFVL